jgi:hypothetical protein
MLPTPSWGVVRPVGVNSPGTRGHAIALRPLVAGFGHALVWAILDQFLLSNFFSFR